MIVGHCRTALCASEHIIGIVECEADGTHSHSSAIAEAVVRSTAALSRPMVKHTAVSTVRISFKVRVQDFDQIIPSEYPISDRHG